MNGSGFGGRRHTIIHREHRAPVNIDSIWLQLVKYLFMGSERTMHIGTCSYVGILASPRRSKQFVPRVLFQNGICNPHLLFPFCYPNWSYV
ncbi:hypothetical protein D1872_319570 [compost metagenome]